MKCRGCGKECADVGFGRCEDCAGGEQTRGVDDVFANYEPHNDGMIQTAKSELFEIFKRELEGEKKPENTIGRGCKCGAYGECECGCDADWNDYSLLNEGITNSLAVLARLMGVEG